MPPNPRPLILLGASVRGLPVSEAPVLEVCSTSNDWSSESDEMCVEWDGVSAFTRWTIRDRPCVLRGDFAVVVRFGDDTRTSAGGQAPISAMRRVVVGFLCYRAIDARKCDIDVHPAYATQILGDRKHSGTDLRVRLAFCYADEQGDDEPTSLCPLLRVASTGGAARDRGLYFYWRPALHPTRYWPVT